MKCNFISNFVSCFAKVCPGYYMAYHLQLWLKSILNVVKILWCMCLLKWGSSHFLVVLLNSFFSFISYFVLCATNAIWPPFFKASHIAENATSLLPPFSDGPPLSWQHAMAQHLLGFSWMASDCISCPGIQSPLSHKHPALSENLQHTEAYRAIEVYRCLRLFKLCLFVLLCVFVCSWNATQRTFSSEKQVTYRGFYTNFCFWCLQKQFHLDISQLSHNFYQLLWFIATTFWAKILNLSSVHLILPHPT